MRRVFLSLVVSGLAAAAVPRVAPPAQAVAAPAGGAIRGRVAFLREVRPSDPRPAITDLGMPDGQHGAPDDQVAVVYLETAPRGAFEERPGPTVVLDQRNETFIPHVLAITTGTTVQFLNSDKTYHNVFSLSRPKRFDLGRYPTGRSKSVRFDRPGIVRVFCEIHSHMSAFILVFGHPFFTMTDADGRYRLDNIPPGTYSVVAWNEGTSSDPASVTVPNGGTAELDIPVR